jgi:hypothetical protein
MSIQKLADDFDSQDVAGPFKKDLLRGLKPLIVHEEEPEEDIEERDDDVEVSDEPGEEGVVFIIDDIPGAPGAEAIEVDEGDKDVEIDESEMPEGDEWKWETPTFIPWLQKMIKNVPQHTGYDTTGLEKAISYFESIDREITKAMRTDYKNEINSAHAEKAREEIENGLERLMDRLEKVRTTKYKRHAKKKSKSWTEEYGIVKEAGTAKITGITVTVPLLIARIARVCINGMVSAGHDIEDIFEKQAKEYNLDKRERAELAQLLDDMGYAVRMDRGYPVGEHVDTTKSDNFDWAANYPG